MTQFCVQQNRYTLCSIQVKIKHSPFFPGLQKERGGTYTSQYDKADRNA